MFKEKILMLILIFSAHSIMAITGAFFDEEIIVDPSVEKVKSDLNDKIKKIYKLHLSAVELQAKIQEAFDHACEQLKKSSRARNFTANF
jgi:hypothetical protein